MIIYSKVDTFETPDWTLYPSPNLLGGVIGCYTATVGREIVGYLVAMNYGLEDIVNIHLLEVSPDYQRRGIGTQLLAMFIADIGNKPIVVNVDNTDQAKKFYKKNRFVVFKNINHNYSTPIAIKTSGDTLALKKKILGGFASSYKIDI